MGFNSASSICGFIFYCLAQGERFERYKPLVVGFGLIYFISAIITLFIIFKCSYVIENKSIDENGIVIKEGLRSSSFLGLLCISIINIVLFNPFFPIPSLFEYDTYDGILNKGYVFMGAILVLNSYLYYVSKQQIKALYN